ncbi:MAG: TIGR03790 family protein [Candidatus Thiodiazotropha lotti]|nr:TIGR03790 family protein [Candidatus Thiodiazotropha lotti]MCG7999063.1 TIGR03790 family protein [Candidatus Thiodiazotropha lotti]MCW4181954.1 TIGR03790 family protein [Candidatus Thiodiazotropha weberae]MCW4190831.1 TIGR03790 family protein [Candidatus Thiodiazotropha weberae]
MDIGFDANYSTWNLVGFFLLLSLSLGLSAEILEIDLPRQRLTAEQLAVVVNDQDPLSQRIGNYYVEARGIPAANLLHVSFKPGKKNLPPQQFQQIRQKLLKITPQNIQAYAITWIAPFRVGCMSVTSALTFGYDKAWCSDHTCASTRHSPYYDYRGVTPYNDLSIRPSISIAANSFAEAKALIERGIAADGTLPEGTAYLMSTQDKQRNVRAKDYLMTRRLMHNWIDTVVLRGNTLRDRKDVLFYFTGRTHIDGLETLTFLPGAIADHLTSTGGVLSGSKQMSALRWLEAGATGSFGTVVEPCNHLGKFPNPRLVMEHYSHGQTLLEAYWRSVQQPGEGLFIGEPLAAPYDKVVFNKSATGTRLITRNLTAGLYRLSHSTTPIGPFRQIQRFRVKPHQQQFDLSGGEPGYYRIESL